ncbi:protein RADIALIS-like 3 isoform X2 [Asparagus officinalis]|uniref:protein RADIALIS-like 3 isoform X2 n=1 Tax=Asparagus officinalis TaxID=4686 RepID=UPI00098E59E9|nr:protein RADIALIS-like 3 isoform X2 [Asparagus officinalis]
MNNKASFDQAMSSLYGWSWEENKIFEIALAVIDEDNPDRWNEIVSIIGGRKSIEEVKKHYESLLEDLSIIESGRLDEEVDDEQDYDDQCAVCAEEDQKLLEKLRTADFSDQKLLSHEQDISQFPPS